jgi:hypothetical protein
MALRQTTGFVESLLRPIGPDWSGPDFGTLRRRQRTPAVDIPHRGSNGPLHLPIDGTGIEGEGEGEWNARKHGGAKRRVRRRIRLGIDERTPEVRAIEVATSDIGDAPMPPELLGQIAPHHEVASVAADGACDTRRRHDAIAARGAAAVVPPRRTARPWKETAAGAAARDEALRASRHLGRAIRRGWSGHRRRSRAETKMPCTKPMGRRLMARDLDRRVAETHVGIAAPYRFTALGMPVIKAMGSVRPGKRKLRPTGHLRNRVGAS